MLTRHPEFRPIPESDYATIDCLRSGERTTLDLIRLDGRVCRVLGDFPLHAVAERETAADWAYVRFPITVIAVDGHPAAQWEVGRAAWAEALAWAAESAEADQ